MILADIGTTAPERLEPDCILFTVFALLFFLHDNFLLVFFIDTSFFFIFTNLARYFQ